MLKPNTIITKAELSGLFRSLKIMNLKGDPPTPKGEDDVGFVAFLVSGNRNPERFDTCLDLCASGYTLSLTYKTSGELFNRLRLVQLEEGYLVVSDEESGDFI